MVVDGPSDAPPKQDAEKKKKKAPVKVVEGEGAAKVIIFGCARTQC